MKETITILQSAWLDQENKRLTPEKSRRAKRQYLHFDNRINIINNSLAGYIFNEGKISKHSFYPFVRNSKIKKVYKKEPKESPYKTRIIKKIRPIDYSAHKDAVVLSWYAFQLSTEYELIINQLGLENNVIAYRSVKKNSDQSLDSRGMSTYDHVAVVADFIKNNRDFVTVALDVEKFFEQIDHKKLKESWESILNVLRLPIDHYNIFRYVTDYRFVELKLLRKHLGFKKQQEKKMSRICSAETLRLEVIKKGLLKRNPLKVKGIPQGSSISCVLSNIYMLPFDISLKKRIESVGGMYMRYSDDILVIVPRDSITEICDFAENFLNKNLNLKLNKDKTELTSFEEVDGFLKAQDFNNKSPAHLSYLGINFDGERFYLRHKAIARHQKRMRVVVKKSHDISLQKNQSIRRHFPKLLRVGGQNTWTYAKRVSEVLNSREIKTQTSDKRLNKKIQKLSGKFKPKNN